MMKNRYMTGQTAFVCGASKGIGAATAIELSKQGVNAVLLARSKEGLDDVISKLDKSKGQDHRTIIADFSSPENLQQKVGDFLKGFDKQLIKVKKYLYFEVKKM